MMKQGLLVLVLIVSTGMVFAQQMDLHTQYIFNEMNVNPAVAGTKDYIPIQINYRKQWTSFPGAPTTQMVSCHAEVFKNVGFGGSFFNDNSGPSRRTGLNINGSYFFNMDRKKNKLLAMGFGLSLAQHSIDPTKLTTYLPNDPAVERAYNNQFVPDANIGVYYKWKENAFVGLSAYNLVQSNRNLFDFENIVNNPLVRTYYLNAGYEFFTEGNYSLKTSTLIRAIETGTVQFDINAMGVYKNLAWLGVSYRHLDAVAFLAGVQLTQVRLGYSYDFTISDIGKYSNGSHEIFIEMHLYNKGYNGIKKGKGWFKKSQRFAPRI